LDARLLVAVDGADELLEFVEGLLPQVVAVDQEQNPFGVGVLDQPVTDVDRREGFS